MFDWFFDCLKTRNASEGKGKRKKKPDLDPYRSVEDKSEYCKLIFMCICILFYFLCYVSVVRGRLFRILR